jgi:hypothetical protein
MSNQLAHNNENILFSKVAEIIISAQAGVVRAVNLTMVYAYYNIGKYIVEDEQQGKQRAGYGKAVIKELSERLNERFGRGYSVQNLEYMRNFFLSYSGNQLSQTVFGILPNADNKHFVNSQTLSGNLQESEIQAHEISETLSRKLEFN